MTVGGSVMPRLGGTALRATKNGLPERRATAMVAGSEARSKGAMRLGISTTVAARIMAAISSLASPGPSMKTHSTSL